jgi:hypothetical protein
MWPKWLTLAFYEGLWDDFVEYMDDLPIKVLKGVLEAVAEVLEAIDAPDFLSTHQLGDVLAPVMPYIGHFLAQAGISQGLSLIAAAIAFRVSRKILTFGMW